MGKSAKGGKGAEKRGAKKDGLAGIIGGAEALLGNTLATPEAFVEKPDHIVSALRGACSSFYTAARMGVTAGAPRIYTSQGFSVDQILPQLDDLTDAVRGSVEAQLAEHGGPSPADDDNEETASPTTPAVKKGSKTKRASAPAQPAVAEVEEADEEDEEAEEGSGGDDLSLGDLNEEELAALEAMAAEEEEEGEEDEEDEEGIDFGEEEGMEEDEEEVAALDALQKKGTRINAAKKMISRQEEEAELAQLEAAYGKRKKSGKKKGQDEEADLLDRIEAEIGESGTDDSYEAPIGTKEKARKTRKTASSKPEHTGFEGFEADGEDVDEEDEELDEDMMAEMQQDADALREMYGVGAEDEGERFGADEEGFDEEQMDQEDTKAKRAAAAKDEEEPQYSSDEEEVELDEPEDDEDDIDPNSSLTPFQQRQQKLLKKIKRVEDNRLEETHWTLKGETMASSRPDNALLEEVLEFDHTQRAKTLVTEELTKSLEERLKKRIQENLFDDVERKEARSSALDLTIKHKNEIDLHAKSKVGLADLYEKEWLDNHRKELEKAGQSSHELTEEEKEELKVIQMWRNLSSSLDLLSNFFYTPKAMPSDELQIRASQKSAIGMEEATPTAVSSASLLAPQDVQAPSKRKYDDMGEDEMTTHHKKRLRRTIKDNHKAKDQRKVHQKDLLEKKKGKVARAKAVVEE